VVANETDKSLFRFLEQEEYLLQKENLKSGLKITAIALTVNRYGPAITDLLHPGLCVATKY